MVERDQIGFHIQSLLSSSVVLANDLAILSHGFFFHKMGVIISTLLPLKFAVNVKLKFFVERIQRKLLSPHTHVR